MRRGGWRGASSEVMRECYVEYMARVVWRTSLAVACAQAGTVKKAPTSGFFQQTRRLLRILGGDVSQKDQLKCHS
jgi:hypothetical protein